MKQHRCLFQGIKCHHYRHLWKQLFKCDWDDVGITLNIICLLILQMLLLSTLPFILISLVFSCMPPLDVTSSVKENTKSTTTVASGTIIADRNHTSIPNIRVGIIMIDCVYKSSVIDSSLIQGKNITVSGFGSSSLCLSDVTIGQRYLFLFNPSKDPAAAEYGLISYFSTYTVDSETLQKVFSGLTEKEKQLASKNTCAAGMINGLDLPVNDSSQKVLNSLLLLTMISTWILLLK